MKLAYDEPTYERIQAALPPRYPDLHRVVSPVVPAAAPDANPPLPPTLSTCFLETGPAKRGSMVRFEECDEEVPTAKALHEYAGPRLADLCYRDGDGGGGGGRGVLYWGGSGRGNRSGSGSGAGLIPRALLQLAPFPLSPDEAALDEEQAPRGAAAVAWHER